jgi:hypothetical protein
MMMYLKIINHFGGDIVSSRRHLQNISELNPPYDWNWFSKDNFKFYSFANGDLDTNLFNTPLNALASGVDNINI